MQGIFDKKDEVGFQLKNYNTMTPLPASEKFVWVWGI